MVRWLAIAAMEAVMAGKDTRVALEDGKGNVVAETTVGGIEKACKAMEGGGGKQTRASGPKSAFDEMNGEIVAAFDEWLAIEKEREALNDRVKILLKPFKASHEWKPALLKRIFREKRKEMRDRETFEVDQHQMELFADALGIGGGS